MIIFPSNWRQLGKEVFINDIDNAMRQIMSEIKCTNLSFSGGGDSSLLLYYLLEVKGNANAYTCVNDANHPDIEYSRKALDYFEQIYKIKIPHHTMIRPNVSGDELVKSYYGALSCLLTDIIAGDCIDELACGYYGHQDLQEETYQDYLQKVQSNHLEPLNENSGNVRVYLPFADDRVASLFHRIPVYKKVSKVERKIIINLLADGKVPQCVIERRKYGLGTSLQKVSV